MKNILTREEEKEKLYWKVHTPNLLKEILNKNPGLAIFAQPLSIFADILYQIGDRAIALNDPELLLLCCRLTLFDNSDPESKDYDKEIFHKLEDLIKQKSNKKD